MDFYFDKTVKWQNNLDSFQAFLFRCVAHEQSNAMYAELKYLEIIPNAFLCSAHIKRIPIVADRYIVLLMFLFCLYAWINWVCCLWAKTVATVATALFTYIVQQRGLV